MRKRNVENATFLVLLGFVTFGALLVVWDFLRPVFWAAVLAVLFSPVQRFWTRRVGGREASAAGLSVLTVLVLAIVPVAFVGYSVTREAISLYDQLVRDGLEVTAPTQWLEEYAPSLDQAIRGLGIDLEAVQAQLQEAAVTTGRALGSWALRLGQNVARLILATFVMLYVLFFFFRDGSAIVERIIHAIPVGEEREQHLVRRFVEVSRGTVKGTLLIGLIQGTLGGFAFWALGVHAAVLWGAVMVVLSILPVVGASLVWLPAAIVMLVSGRWAAGIALILFGTLVIGLIDNFLRPILVGRDAKMPDYLILISTLGGLALVGITGFVLGPLIVALFLVMWETFGREFARTEEPLAEPPS